MTEPIRVKSIRLDDVQESEPSESEEEKRVMRYLERSNPTGMSSRFFDAVTSIPEDLASQISTEDPDSMTPTPKNNFGGELYALTNSINLLHLEMHSNNADTANATSAEGEQPSVPAVPAKVFQGTRKEHSQADQFAANAGQLYQRYTFSKKKRKKKLFGKNNKKKNEDDIPTGDVESNTGSGRGSTGSGKGASKYLAKSRIALEPLYEFRNLVTSKRGHVLSYVRDSFFFIIMPSTILAGILYYFFGNPMVGEGLNYDEVTFYFDDPTTAPLPDGTPTAAPIALDEVNGGNPHLVCKHGQVTNGPSVSWWVLFLGVRQVITLGFARAAQFLIMNYVLKINFSGMMGPSVRLLFLQARGWPFIMTLWAVFNFIMLYGPRRFARHWIYYQDLIELFNECNPAGNVTSGNIYLGLLAFSIYVGLLVAIKRFWIGLRFGKASYFRYAEKLSQVLKEQLLLSKVAKSAQIEYFERLEDFDLSKVSVLEEWHRAGDDEQEGDAYGSDTTSQSPTKSPNPNRPNRLRTASVASAPFLTPTQNESIEELLGAWEDIDIDAASEIEREADLSSIIQFRASLSVLESATPYSPVFGEARTRSEVIKRSEELYFQLLKKQQFLEGQHNFEEDEPILRFHTIALTASKSSQYFDRRMCRNLVKLFRPARNGNISKLEFCKSIDNQYKELRKLRASIANEGRVNTASEQIINVAFYVIMGVTGLWVMGIDPFALFALLTSFILGFSFMISGASSDYFRGLLFITVQRPYDIGDRVNVSGSDSQSSPNGSSGWIVKDVNLYHTTFLFGTTMEYATISNGALSGARIINAARSPRAMLNFIMKFGITVQVETVAAFKEQIIAYVKDKPREWLSFAAFRMTRIEANLGFVEYKIVAEHRESWQQIGALLTSLADLSSFAFELSREMKMGYKAPVMPVELKMIEEDTEQSLPLMPPVTSFFSRS